MLQCKNGHSFSHPHNSYLAQARSRETAPAPNSSKETDHVCLDAKAHPALSGYDLPEAHGVTHRVRRLFGGLSLWLQERRAYSRAFEELQSLSDRELADIGISRADISFIARDGARARIRNGL
jgi:uncharacterized protein YjiS (DUF1127 family)